MEEVKNQIIEMIPVIWFALFSGIGIVYSLSLAWRWRGEKRRKKPRMNYGNLYLVAAIYGAPVFVLSHWIEMTDLTMWLAVSVIGGGVGAYWEIRNLPLLVPSDTDKYRRNKVRIKLLKEEGRHDEARALRKLNKQYKGK